MSDAEVNEEIPAVGNDGLTDSERQVYADKYRDTMARRTLPEREIRDIEAWLAARRAR